MLTGSQIRRKFLDYFIQKGHREVHSSPLVPQNDPTLLFTNAGMNQFKDVFLGLEKRDYARAASSQKCVRAGGKHNDLENVGFTNRHHTFFEMLGNFSFGDYFKEKAIAHAWELITSDDWFGISKDKLYITVFEQSEISPGQVVAGDHESLMYWSNQATGLLPDRIRLLGAETNFWAMGDTGPCGPCSEIHYDMGPAASDQGHTDCKFGCECGRYVEIWNLVFMQFDRDASGKLTPLPKPSIDTGMGLERIATVLQGVISNYDTDLFVPLTKRAGELVSGDAHVEPGLRPGWTDQRPVPTQQVPTQAATRTGHVGTGLRPVQAERSSAGSKSAASLRVIADHSRAATFLISDGVTTSNEGRGYVLRKIIRRAITHGRLLGQTKPFLHEMVFAVRDLMQDAYPELKESAERVSKAVLAEETRFAHTMDVGLARLESLLANPSPVEVSDVEGKLLEYMYKANSFVAGRSYAVEARRFLEAKTDAALIEAGTAVAGPSALDLVRFLREMNVLSGRKLDGREAFKLYDTFGLPLDFMTDAARDQGVYFDHNGFAKGMFEQRERAKASWKGGVKQPANPSYRDLPKTAFEGYRQTESKNCEVLAIVKDGKSVPKLDANELGEIILDHTPFYAESGGQVGDTGRLYRDSEQVAWVTGCYSPVQGVRAHKVGALQEIRVDDRLEAKIDTGFRDATMRNHTATHLLHAGLREVLGKHVKQAGSLVAPNHLRFDFSHFTGVEDEELQDIEDIINKEVLRNEKVEVIENVPIDVAVNEYHAMALFGEKYGDKVRVIKIGDFSTELCGGTHTLATGEIGLIKILKEGSVSSGVRRIEAVTGEGSLRHFRKDHELEGVVASLTSKEADSPADALRAELERRDAEIKRLARELDQARMKSASSSVASASDNIREVRGVKVLAHRVDNLERSQMRTLVDQLRDKLGSGVVVVGSASNGNVSLIAGVTKDLTSRIQAGKVVDAVAQKVGGKGGGRPDLAEAGGKNPEALDSALAEVYNIVELLLG